VLSFSDGGGRYFSNLPPVAGELLCLTSLTIASVPDHTPLQAETSLELIDLKLGPIEICGVVRSRPECFCGESGFTLGSQEDSCV